MTQQQSPNLHLPDGGKIQAIQEEGLMTCSATRGNATRTLTPSGHPR